MLGLVSIYKEIGCLGRWAAVTVPLLLPGCSGDDDGDSSTGAAAESSTGMADDDRGGGPTSGMDQDDGDSDQGADGTTDGGGSTTEDLPGDTNGIEDDGTDGTTGEPEDPGTYAALVRGDLFTDDLAMAQNVHDAISMMGEETATALGDFGHDAKLGTALLGGTQNTFLGLDQWDNLAGAQMLYSDPDFAKGFGMLFDGMPTLELFELREDWHSWGDLEAGDGDDHWFVVVRGTLADDPDAIQPMHDMLAAGGQEASMAAGDVAHVVWLGAEDNPNEFFAVDVWNDDTNIEGFYGNPDFGKAFGALFDGQPTVVVYASTDWHQW